MDQVLSDTLAANLKAAETPQEQLSALTLATIALVDCQRKTSDRVKNLVNEQEAIKNKKEGMKFATGVVISIASTVGPTAAIAFCKFVGILF